MIDKIQHYSLTNQASIFDEEALTALELAGRTAAKVNECVEVVNETVDTLPGMVDDEVQEHIDNGDFAKQVDKYAGELTAKVNKVNNDLTKNINDVNTNLTARINNIIAPGEGTGTLDEEVIDARLGNNAHPYPTAGESIRSEMAAKQEAFVKKTEIALTVHPDTLFNIHTEQAEAYESGEYARYDLNGETLLCINGYGWGWDAYPVFAVYNENGGRIFRHFPGVNVSEEGYMYPVPSNAAYIIITGHTAGKRAQLWACETLKARDVSRTFELLSADQMANHQPTGTKTFAPYALHEGNTEIFYGIIRANTWGWAENVNFDTLRFELPRDWASIKLTNYNTGDYGGCFLDADKKALLGVNTAYPNYLEPYTIPEGARYLDLTVRHTDPYHDVYGEIDSFRLSGLVVDSVNPWQGKKVVWLGTSIPHGTSATKSYVQELANNLGLDIVPAFTPGVATHMDNNAPRVAGSIVATKAEHEAAGLTVPDAPTAWVPGNTFTRYYMTYENIFTAENADADMWVFDTIPNNGNWSTSDWDAFDFDNWAYSDGSAFSDHRNTFLGAMLFLIDQMYKVNPKARMVLLITCQLNYTPGKPCFDKLAEKFNIAVINTWGRMTTTPQALTQTIIDPVNDPHLTNYAHERIGRMLTGEFMRLA